MSHVFHQLYFHFAWATHSREPLIDRVWRPQLLEIINEEVKTRGGWPIRHNAMPDHAHLLCRLPPTVLTTLIDRKNIIVAEPYLICWRDLNARKMIGLKHCGESLLKEANAKQLES